MSEEDSGLPEESSSKLDQTNAVPVRGEGPWKNDADMWTFQNYDDLEKYGADIVSGSATVVLVIDNQGTGLPGYVNNKHYWVIENADYGDGFVQLFYRHSVEYFSLLVEEGSATMEDFNTESNLDFLGPGRIKVDTFQGFPIYIRDDNIDDSRPVSQTASTTGATTGTTVQTTTTQTPGAATASTTSEIVPAEIRTFDLESGTEVLSTEQITDLASNAIDSSAVTSAGNYDDAIQRAARGIGVASSEAPCLPNTPGSGSGSTAPSSEPYQDAILRQARINGASPSTSGNNQQVGPSTVTGNNSQANQGSGNTQARPPSVYIYEPLTPGFDRYDFNTGKKVYTPDTGPSRNSSAQTTTPSGNNTVTGAQRTEQQRVENVLAARASGASLGF